MRRTTAAILAIVALAAGPADAEPGSAALQPPAAPDAPGSGPASQPVAPAPAPVPLVLSASFGGDVRPIRQGLVWRVFDEAGGGRPVLVASSAQAGPTIPVLPGRYVLHVAYGLASASKRIEVGPNGATEKLSLTAGALKLGGSVGDAAIAGKRLSFNIYVPVGNDSEARLVAANVRAGEVIRLPDGNYHVVSTFGESNAIMRVDIRVEPGKLTEATVNHRAATVTLKLVAAPGGEAFAGTAFSVLTPGGDTIREAIGAFPTVTLAEGDYVLIARHDGNVYTREFKVESGLDRDIEALARTE